MCYFNKKTI